MAKVSIEITDILQEGKCPAGHKLGETFTYPEDVGKICPAAFNSIYPDIRIIESGGSFPFYDEPTLIPSAVPIISVRSSSRSHDDTNQKSELLYRVLCQL